MVCWKPAYPRCSKARVSKAPITWIGQDGIPIHDIYSTSRNCPAASPGAKLPADSRSPVNQKQTTVQWNFVFFTLLGHHLRASDQTGHRGVPVNPLSGAQTATHSARVLWKPRGRPIFQFPSILPLHLLVISAFCCVLLPLPSSSHARHPRSFFFLLNQLLLYRDTGQLQSSNRQRRTFVLSAPPVPSSSFSLNDFFPLCVRLGRHMVIASR